MTNAATDADKELSQKKRQESLEERCKALHLECAQQSKQVGQLLEYSDYLVKEAKTLIQGKSRK